jgi:hypothetical protein
MNSIQVSTIVFSRNTRKQDTLFWKSSSHPLPPDFFEGVPTESSKRPKKPDHIALRKSKKNGEDLIPKMASPVFSSSLGLSFGLLLNT